YRRRNYVYLRVEISNTYRKKIRYFSSIIVHKTTRTPDIISDIFYIINWWIVQKKNVFGVISITMGRGRNRDNIVIGCRIIKLITLADVKTNIVSNSYYHRSIFKHFIDYLLRSIVPARSSPTAINNFHPHLGKL